MRKQCLILLILVSLTLSCKQSTTQDTKKAFPKGPNFDSIIHCGDYDFRSDHFTVPYHGCVYAPNKGNDFGNISIFLIPKKKYKDPEKLTDEQIMEENERIDNLEVNRIKKEFDIYVYLIDKKYLNYNKNADPISYFHFVF